jgi:hypothetical protein
VLAGLLHFASGAVKGAEAEVAKRMELGVDHRRHGYIMIAYSIQILGEYTDECHLSQAAR